MHFSIQIHKHSLNSIGTLHRKHITLNTFFGIVYKLSTMTILVKIFKYIETSRFCFQIINQLVRSLKKNDNKLHSKY